MEPGERVALLGRNGAGKTTLMKVIAGQIGVDDGKVVRQQGIEVTHLPQEIPADITGSVFDIVASGLGKRGELLKDYYHVSHRLHTEHTPELLRQRIAGRKGHFMKPEMLASQLADLEPPQDALTLDVAEPVAVLVAKIREHYAL